jgi:hypothetical protein
MEDHCNSRHSSKALCYLLYGKLVIANCEWGRLQCHYGTEGQNIALVRQSTRLNNLTNLVAKAAVADVTTGQVMATQGPPRYTFISLGVCVVDTTRPSPSQPV